MTSNQQSTAQVRGRKRPGPSGSPDIREQILNAAGHLFASQGYSATSVREIADRVDVNPAMVHYYFGSKKLLLRAVMDRVLEPMAAAMAALQERGQIRLRDLTDLMFSMAATHPYLPQLVTREVFLSGGQLQQEFLEHFAPRLGGRLPGILQREQDAGRLAPDMDPKIMALLVLGACFFPIIARPLAEPGLHIAYDADGLQRISIHVTDMLERGLGPCAK